MGFHGGDRFRDAAHQRGLETPLLQGAAETRPKRCVIIQHQKALVAKGGDFDGEIGHA